MQQFGSTSERNKTAIFFLWHVNVSLCPCIYRQILVLWYLAVGCWKVSVARLVVFCSIYTYVSFHMSTILTHVQRFWEVTLLRVEYLASLPLLIHITVKRRGAAALTSLTQWCLPLQESFRCGQFKVTQCRRLWLPWLLFHQLGCHGDSRQPWWSVHSEETNFIFVWAAW